jgi:hypothetical protein
MKSKRRNLLLALFVALLGGAAWLLHPSRDPLFHGRPESEWIKSIEYIGDDQQIKQWREFGLEGIGVLVRGLANANHPLERFYCKTYNRIAPRLPGVLFRWLPAPKMDSTYWTRMCVVSLLSRLGKDARLATPAMARVLKYEAAEVRTIAMAFFTLPEDENALLSRMEAKEKRKLLPDFIRAAEDTGAIWELRHNAAFALKYYPEQWETAVPVLANALKDPVRQVRQCAAESLNHLARGMRVKAGVAPIIIGVLKDPNDQIAYRAAQLLGEMRQETALAVPALLESLENTNSLVAFTAAQALVRFTEQTEIVIPALERAAKRTDHAGGPAKWALKQLDSQAAANRGAPK